MSLLDTLLGRTKVKPPNLDALFALPSAAVTLQMQANLVPSGTAAVCFKPASGTGFGATSGELEELLRHSLPESGTTLDEHDDAYGYHWVVLHDPDLEDLVGGAHLVNSTLEGRGFGSQLLCSLFGFRPAQGAGDLVGLVYLYKRGTFYPFVPLDGERRDNERELAVRALLGTDLPVEPDLSRWFPLWGSAALM